MFHFNTQESTITLSRCREKSRKKKIDVNQKVSATKNFKIRQLLSTQDKLDEANDFVLVELFN